MNITVVEGDLLDQDVDVIVNAWNRNIIPWWLLLPQCVSGAIKRRGGNRRVQNGSAILHAEMDAVENAGRLKASDYRRAVLYSTLSPCDMCSGMTLLYRIPRVVVGENRTFRGPEDYVRSRGVSVEIADDPECVRLMEEFIRSHPDLWNEDIGV